VLVEVDVQPFASRGPRAFTRPRDELGPDAESPRSDDRVLQPRVHQAVPDDVDEADERIVVTRDVRAELCSATCSSQIHSYVTVMFQ
jgi:hypothetical protein